MKTTATAQITNRRIHSEIAIYRKLIHVATARQLEMLNQESRWGKSEISCTSHSLSRLLKARRDLAGQELDPAEQLQQALVKLEKEWPELKML